MSSSPPRDPPWTIWDVALLALVIFVAVNTFVLAGFAVAIAAQMDGASVDQLVKEGHVNRPVIERLLSDFRIVVPAQLLSYIVGFAFMQAIVRVRYRKSFWETLRWSWPQGRWWPYPLIGSAMAIAAAALGKFLPVPKSMPIDKLFQSPAAGYSLAAFAVLVAPLMEELFFRGFLYPVLARGIGVAGAIALTGFCFALMHASQLAASWGPLLVLFLVGVILTTIRALARSVAASTVTHMAYNLFIFLMMWLASDHFHHMERLQP